MWSSASSKQKLFWFLIITGIRLTWNSCAEGNSIAKEQKLNHFPPVQRGRGKVVGDQEKRLLCIRTEVKSSFGFLEIFIWACSKSLCDFISSGIVVFLEFLAIRCRDITGAVPSGPGRKRHLEGWYISIIHRNKIFISEFIFMRLWIHSNTQKEIWNGSCRSKLALRSRSLITF